MSLDDELQNHFKTTRDLADTLDPETGLAALDVAASRRHNLARGAGALTVVLVALVGTISFLNGGDDSTDVQLVDDPSPTATTTVDDRTQTQDDALGTAVITVDSDGLVRINGDMYDVFTEDPLFEPLLDNGRSMITDVGGYDGALLIETPEGVYWTDANQTQLRLITGELGARILDVSGPGIRPGGGMRAAIGWVEEGVETLAVFEINTEGGLIQSETTSATDLGGEILDASLGGQDNLWLLITIGADGGCTRHVRTDLDGNPTLLDDVLATRSACLPDEMAGLSESNAVLLSTPTQTGSVNVTIIDRTGGAVNVQSADADLGIGPVVVDTHLDPAGRNEAVVMRNGEGYVYVDMDAVLAAPDDPITGITAVPHLGGAPFTSVRFATGFAQHSLRAGAANEPGDVPGPEPIGDSVGLLTVDENGVVYINETIDTRWDDNPVYDPIDTEGPGTAIRAIDGSLGWLIIEAESGIWWTDPAGSFLDPVVEGSARLLDVADAPFRAVIESDGGLDIIGFDVDGRELLRGRMDAEQLPGTPTNATFDVEAEHILLTIDVADGCNTWLSLNISGEIAKPDGYEPVILDGTGCTGPEIAAWTHDVGLVSAAPGREDNWTLTVVEEDQELAQHQSPGAFQPRRIQTHTSQVTGRTAAVITGNGPEIVFVDVDAYRNGAVTLDGAIAGVIMSGQPNIASSKLVDMLPAHGLDQPREVELPDEPAGPAWPPTDQVVNRVVDVASDDVLNVRSGPGVENNVVFTLPPGFEGAVTFGEPMQLAAGGVWTQVFNPRSDDADESGWVNQAFLEPIDGADNRSCLFNGPQDHYIGLDSDTSDIARTESDATVVRSVETYRFGRCIRTVLELGTEFDFGEGSPLASGFPPDVTFTRGSPSTISFGESIIGANGVTARLIEGDRTSTVALSVNEDRQIVATFWMPTDLTFVHWDEANARIVLDVMDFGTDDPQFGYSAPLFVDDGLIITRTIVENERFTIHGLARPFEAVLGLQLRNADGPVEAEFIGTFDDGAPNISSTAVQTTGWTEAWGEFEFTMRLDEDEVDRLIIDFDPSSGARDESVESITVPLGALTRFAKLP
jgi:hypothetical protein